jgi:transcriptional regulator GlxA family with amidase domain
MGFPETISGRQPKGMFVETAEIDKPARREVPPPAHTSLSPRGGALHRTLKESILRLLEEAGNKGKTADELATELGVQKRRVQSWFSGTGKRTKGVRKIGVGRWKFVQKGNMPL